MKITVSPIPKSDTVGRYIAAERLGKAFDEYKEKAVKHSFEKIQPAKKVYDAGLRKSVFDAFWSIGYRRGTCEGDDVNIIRFQSCISSGMKDLVFKSIADAKEWLVRADVIK